MPYYNYKKLLFEKIMTQKSLLIENMYVKKRGNYKLKKNIKN